MKRLAILVALAAIPLALGCEPKSEDPGASHRDSQATSTASATSARNPGSGTQKDFPGNRVPAVTAPIRVSLSGYTIDMPDTLPSGPQRLLVVNSGEEPHGFAIRGDGYDQTFVGNLSKGDQNEVSIDLKPGQYEAYCPVDGHRARGMTRTITVR